MPYILINCGARSPKRSNQGRRLCTSRASPPNTTWRSARSVRVLWQATCCRALNAEGVWLSTVTPWSQSRAWKSSVQRLTSWGTMTKRPPYNSAPNISHTEKSNA
ncbi:hypothetical protein D3C75_956800 [compost metagenome]